MNQRTLFVIACVCAVALLVLVGCTSGNTSSGTSAPAASSSAPAGSASSGGSSGAASGGSAVTIQNFAFDPQSVTVKVGTTVTWTNKDSATHTVTGSGWGSDQLATGAAYSHTFDKAGSYDYHCSIHPSMTGTIIVQ